MKRSILIGTALFLFIPAVYAQNFSGKTKEVRILPPKNSLIIGEKLEYDILWLGIPVGNILLNVSGIEKVNGRDAYHITGEAKPNDFFAALYDLEYRVDSYMDTLTCCTLSFEKSKIVNGKISKVEIAFDQDKHLAMVKEEGAVPRAQRPASRNLTMRQKEPLNQTIRCSQDIFSTIFYLRLMDLKEKSSYDIPVYYDKRNWITNIKISGAFSRDFHKKGIFDVFGVTIDSDLDELILGMRQMTGLLTADSRRIPMEFRFGSGIGSFYGKIRSIYPPNE